MTHPIPPSLATIVKAEAEKRVFNNSPSRLSAEAGEFARECIEFGAQFLFAHLAGKAEGEMLPHVKFAKLRLNAPGGPNNVDCPAHWGEFLPSVALHFETYISMEEHLALRSKDLSRIEHERDLRTGLSMQLDDEREKVRRLRGALRKCAEHALRETNGKREYERDTYGLILDIARQCMKETE